MPNSMNRKKKLLSDHVDQVAVEMDLTCVACGAAPVEPSGEFSFIGSNPRMPRPVRALKCRQCGHLMFFELPEQPSMD